GPRAWPQAARWLHSWRASERYPEISAIPVQNPLFSRDKSHFSTPRFPGTREPVSCEGGSMDRHALSHQQRAWLVEALDDWRKQGLVSSDQAAGILAIYESPEEMAQRQQSQAIFTLMSIAALLVGLAVLLLIGYNWEDLPRAVKLVVIFGVILGTYAAAFR